MPEQLGDDRYGQRLGEVRDQVELAGIERAVHEPVDDRLHPGRHVRDRPWRERLDTSRRSRVWSGGSRSSIPASLSSWNGACQAGGGVRPNSASVATW